MCDIFGQGCAVKGCKEVIPIHVSDFCLPRSVLKRAYCKSHIPTNAGKYDIYVIKLVPPTKEALRREWEKARRMAKLSTELSDEDEEKLDESYRRQMADYKSGFSVCALEVDTKEAERLLGDRDEQRWLIENTARSLGISIEAATQRVLASYLPVVPKAIGLNTAVGEKVVKHLRAGAKWAPKQNSKAKN